MGRKALSRYAKRVPVANKTVRTSGSVSKWAAAHAHNSIVETLSNRYQLDIPTSRIGVLIARLDRQDDE
ncbi:GPI transamidase component Gpi16 [Aspergillus luchuensis]|uniref:GPI transamidase component Gpi16 n=1 Tax=Aspergillus kawachii TaxID=1069201 RepID=A0A146FFZ5_ASPKA|nr:GPI transamidase component Gpi16 [Aspergillus luchuensis]